MKLQSHSELANETASSPFRTVKQFVLEHQAFSEGGVRFEIFNESTNGLRESGAVIRNGRKVLIHVPRYFRWLDKKNGIVANSIQEVA